MARRPDPERVPRSTARLSAAAIVAAGIELADRDGLDGLSMRRLAQGLGVNPMSLYHHVRDKDALLEAMLDAVVASIAVDDRQPGEAWTDEVRALLTAARRTMLGHPWAVQALQQRQTPTPSTLRHLDRLLAALRRGGCSVELGHHALHLLGSRMLGFSQDLFVDSPPPEAHDPAPGDGSDRVVREARIRAMLEHYPHVAELARSAAHEGGLGGCDDDVEFAFALDVLLDGLERRRLAEAASGHAG